MTQKYLSNFWRILHVLLINCEINLDINWSEKCVIVATAVVNQGTKIKVCFTKKNCKKKTNQKESRVEKAIKRKGNKLYVKWKGYDSSFNSWIDKKYIAI